MNAINPPVVSLEQLAPREQDILRLLAEGLSNRAIAERLYFTLQTVKWYNRQIYEKLGVRNRTEAARLVIEEDFFAADDPQTRIHLHHFPNYLTRFIGRQQEIRAIKELLKEHRLVTVTGVGGTGKTRLGVEIAKDIAPQFEDGVYFVDLAPIADPSMVAATIAETLDIGAPADKSIHAYLGDHLRDKNVLLVIDNFEHVIQQKDLLNALLKTAPMVSFLVTSREVLHLEDEGEFGLGPVGLPSEVQSTDSILASEAVALFIDRLRVHRTSDDFNETDIQTIAQICIQLDGLPLAIELAAARHRVLSLDDMRRLLNKRLAVLRGGARDQVARQQTLRATIDWSYELLSDDEKILFANLSVFRGGCTFEAIQAVCREGLSHDFDLVEGLTALVDKSLITYQHEGDGRFSMLVPLAEYGFERLVAEERLHALNLGHAEYYTTFGETSYYVAPDLDSWSRQLATEHDNLQTAMVWCLENDYVDLAARMMIWTSWRWNIHPSIYDWYELGIQILAKRDALAPNLRGLVLAKVGCTLAVYCSDRITAHQMNKEAVALLREHGTPEELGHALIVSGTVEAATESLEIFTVLNNLTYMAWSHNNLGEYARRDQDYERAKFHYEQGLALADQADFHTTRSMIQINLALTLLYLEEPSAAQSILLEASEIVHTHQDIIKTAHLMGVWGCLAVNNGRYEQAAVFFGVMEQIVERLGIRLDPIDTNLISRYQTLLQDQLPPADYQSGLERGRAMSVDDAIAFACDLPLNGTD